MAALFLSFAHLRVGRPRDGSSIGAMPSQINGAVSSPPPPAATQRGESSPYLKEQNFPSSVDQRMRVIIPLVAEVPLCREIEDALKVSEDDYAKLC